MCTYSSSGNSETMCTYSFSSSGNSETMCTYSAFSSFGNKHAYYSKNDSIAT